MPALTAERLCPSAVFVPPDFTRYRAVSRSVREIFALHTDLIEPLSLDEAYLDVTETKSGLTSGLEVAVSIRTQIREELDLAASAGVAPNKFLAKIASDWNKPDGLFEIKPEDVLDFLLPLPVGRLPGVGKVTEERLNRLGHKTVGDIRALGPAGMELNFGSYGRRLYELSIGVDESVVDPDRPTQSISAEDTFEKDVPLDETRATVERLAERVWDAAGHETRVGRTVVLKLKTSDFKIITRSHTPPTPPSSLAEILEIAAWLFDKVALDPATRYRLAGIGIGNFSDPEVAIVQPSLFA
jgi:DNA polymerase-4